MSVRRFGPAGLLAWALGPIACNSSGNSLVQSDAAPDAVLLADAGGTESGSVIGTSDGSLPLCDGSLCQPLVLAEGTNPSTAGGLTVDATNVYWVDSSGGQILACKKTGCARAPTVLASGQGGPAGIAVSAGTVFWTNSTAGTVSSCSVNGCNNHPRIVASGRASPSGIAADASNVYWVETGEGGSVASCAIAGCTSPTVLAAALGLLIVVDDANVYWTDGAEANSCPIGGCSAAPTILFKAAGATGIAIDAQNVYVTTDLRNIDSASGAVLSCAKTGCGGEPIALATGQSGPLPIAVSDGTVFWGNTQGDISLWGCATAGCMQTPTLITMAALPISLAADGPSLYWASLGAILYFPE